MTGTLLSFMAMAVAARELSDTLTPFQIIFFRSTVSLVIISILIFRTGPRAFTTRHLRLHLARNTAHFIAQYGWFYGIAFLPLAQVFAIEFTLPVWSAIFAVLILHERLTLPRTTAVILGLTGMLIILRPGLGEVNTAALVVLFSAVCLGLAHTLTKTIVVHDAPATILFYMSLIQLPLGLCFSVHNWHTPDLMRMPWILVVGISSLTAHFCMAKALELSRATVVIPIDFLRLPLIALVGALVYQEPLDGYLFIGAAVMLSGNLINIRAEQKYHDTSS